MYYVISGIRPFLCILNLSLQHITFHQKDTFQFIFILLYLFYINIEQKKNNFISFLLQIYFIFVESYYMFVFIKIIFMWRERLHRDNYSFIQLSCHQYDDDNDVRRTYCIVRFQCNIKVWSKFRFLLNWVEIIPFSHCLFYILWLFWFFYRLL